MRQLQLSHFHFESSAKRGLKHDLIRDICHLVGKDGPLHEFDMSYSKIDPENLNYIMDAISDNDSLKTFSLKGI